jgi:hypothetical protein
MKRPAQTLKDQLAWFPLDAAAIIEAEQPLVMARCQFPPTAGRTVIATLEFLSELQNADTHRALNVVVPRVVRPSVRAICREREIPVPQHHFLTPCANVLTAADVPTAVPLDEIDVSVFGTPEVAVKAPDLPEEYALLSVTLGILHHVEASIIPSLEPYARP